MRFTRPGRRVSFSLFFFNDTATTEIYTLSLHDALPICAPRRADGRARRRAGDRHLRGWRLSNGRARSGRASVHLAARSEEHTSELQSPCNLVCRLLLEKKKTQKMTNHTQPVVSICCIRA